MRNEERRFEEMEENIHVTVFRNALNAFHVNPNKINTLCENLASIIMCHGSPEHYWSLLGYGAFKECYDIGEDVIVKFASEENATDKEEEILALAAEADLSDVFLPSIFIPLDDDKLPTTYLECNFYNPYTWDESAGTYVRNEEVHISKDVEFNYIIVQKKIATTEGKLNSDGENNYFLYNFTTKMYKTENLLDENGKVIPFTVLDSIDIFSKRWLRSAIDRFGSEFLYRLADFNEENHISDLHEHNIGYLDDGTPVILDWLS